MDPTTAAAGTDVEVGLEGGEGEAPGLCEGLDLLETRRREQGAELSRIAEGEVPRGCCRVLGRVPSDDGIDAGGEGALGRKAAGKLAAVRYAEEAVVVIATVGEGSTTGGVDEHAIEAVADADACRPKPVTAADTAAALIEQGD